MGNCQTISNSETDNKRKIRRELRLNSMKNQRKRINLNISFEENPGTCDAVTLEKSRRILSGLNITPEPKKKFKRNSF
jgi:hypothetical protein